MGDLTTAYKYLYEQMVATGEATTKELNDLAA
jgi:hypothetical protein